MSDFPKAIILDISLLTKAELLIFRQSFHPFGDLITSNYYGYKNCELVRGYSIQEDIPNYEFKDRYYKLPVIPDGCSLKDCFIMSAKTTKEYLKYLKLFDLPLRDYIKRLTTNNQ